MATIEDEYMRKMDKAMRESREEGKTEGRRLPATFIRRIRAIGL